MTLKEKRERPMSDRFLIYRHSLPVRIAHWTVVLCFGLLFMSGLQIFNAHPALYWGSSSNFEHPVLALRAADDSTDQNPKGATVLFGHPFNTTGFLGVSKDGGSFTERGFPSWLTIPSDQDLAVGRRWHLFFAWWLVAAGAFYLIYAFVSGHARRDLVPKADELRHIGRSIVDHMRLHFPKGDAARRYNVLQKLAYVSVAFVVFPILILAGLAMSPGVDARVPELLWLFGGRQSARTIHFICAWSIVLFVIVHVTMVLITGVWNNLRSMITGRYAIATEKTADEASVES